MSIDRQGLREMMARKIFGRGATRPDRYGLEIEVFPIRWKDGQAENVSLFGTGCNCSAAHREGTIPIIRDFARSAATGVAPVEVALPDGTRIEPSEGQSVGAFTFEPGGQIEFSGSAFATPAEAYTKTSSVLDAVGSRLSQDGIELYGLGLEPWHTLDEIGLQTLAPRYESMNDMFRDIGPYGQRMMRQTATVHVNLDFSSGDRALDRWRAAQLLSPFALATFANSPILEQKVTGFRSFRGEIWRHAAPNRCGVPERFLADSSTDPVDQYLDFALNAEVMVIRSEQGWFRPETAVTFAEWMEHGYAGCHPEEDDFLYHLTTLFPEVRPKGFMELRASDGQGRAFSSVPLTWWTALIGDDRSLSRVLDELRGTEADWHTYREHAARDGASSDLIGDRVRKLYGIARESVLASKAGFYSDEMRRSFEVFGERFTDRGRTPADDVLETFQRHGLDQAAFQGMQDAWSEAAGTSTPSSNPAKPS